MRASCLNPAAPPEETTGHHNSSAPETDLRLIAAPLLNSSRKSSSAALSGVARSWSEPGGSPRASCNRFSLPICGALGGGPGHVPGIGFQPSVAANLPRPLPRSLPLTHKVYSRNFPLVERVGYERTAFLAGRGGWE